MNNNDILRRLRFALKLKDSHAASLFSTDPTNAVKVDSTGFRARIAKEEEDDFVATTDLELTAFLDGLIADRRGLRENAVPMPQPERLTKDEILKKLRIAFALRDEGMLKVLGRGGSKISKGELSALFRKPGHKHYRECGNQIIRAFMMGLIDRPTDLPDDDEDEGSRNSPSKPVGKGAGKHINPYKGSKKGSSRGPSHDATKAKAGVRKSKSGDKIDSAGTEKKHRKSKPRKVPASD